MVVRATLGKQFSCCFFCSSLSVRFFSCAWFWDLVLDPCLLSLKETSVFACESCGSANKSLSKVFVVIIDFGTCLRLAVRRGPSHVDRGVCEKESCGALIVRFKMFCHWYWLGLGRACAEVKFSHDQILVVLLANRLWRLFFERALSLQLANLLPDHPVGIWIEQFYLVLVGTFSHASSSSEPGAVAVFFGCGC